MSYQPVAVLAQAVCVFTGNNRNSRVRSSGAFLNKINKINKIASGTLFALSFHSEEEKLYHLSGRFEEAFQPISKNIICERCPRHRGLIDGVKGRKVT